MVETTRQRERDKHKEGACETKNYSEDTWQKGASNRCEINALVRLEGQKRWLKGADKAICYGYLSSKVE